MDEESPPPVSSKPSQVPSWVTLGFVLGALFVLALPRKANEAAQPAPAPAAAPSKPAEPVRISTIEAVFAAWDRFAVWSGDTTEVALWSPETKSFSECYEVRRFGDTYFFRTIPSLTRPVLSHGVVEDSPLEFTETAKQRQQWLDEVSKENQRAFLEGVHQSFGGATTPLTGDTGK
jgi:hypothetical protein